jgi:hypothetical protein
MSIGNDDFINIRAIKRDLENIKKESKNASLWEKIESGFERVSTSMERVIPGLIKMGAYPTAALAIVVELSKGKSMLAQNEPLRQFLGDMATSVGYTAFGAYAVMLLTTNIYEGIKSRSDKKNTNVNYLLLKAQKRSVELGIELDVRPDSNATKVARDLLKNLNKTLFSGNDNKKLELETEYMFGSKHKKKFKI